MNDNQQPPTAPQKLEKAYTFFIVPFYYDGNWTTIYQRLDRWVPIMEDLYKEDVLYPYIMDIFKHESSNTRSRLMIYKFRTEDNGTNSKMFIDRILGKQHIALIGRNASEKKKPQQIRFSLMDTDNYAPHLFISPSAKIGILTFSFKIDGTDILGKQITLNYWLHKRNETGKYQCACPSLEKQEESGLFQEDKLQEIIPQLWKLHQKNTMKNNEYVCWNVNDFVNCILGTMGVPRKGEERIQYFSSSRIHLFSFYSVNDVDNLIDNETMSHCAMRLSRCVETNYMLPFEQMKNEGTLLQTYKNIFFASSIEGASMICIGKEGNEKFFNEIHSKFNRQYLLVYLLVLLQRYTLQSLERKLTEYESTDKKSDEKLWNLIEIICRIKTNCYYTDVSIYTHHSQFYHLCCNNLKVPETFKEVGEKVELLKMTTERKTQQSQKKAERLQRLLNIIVAILTIFQVMEAVYELSTAEKDVSIALNAGKICLCLILIAYLWSYSRDSFKNLFIDN